MSQYEFGIDKEADWVFYTVAHSFQSEHIIDISYSSKLDEAEEKILGSFPTTLFSGLLAGTSGCQLDVSDSRDNIFLVCSVTVALMIRIPCV